MDVESSEGPGDSGPSQNGRSLLVRYAEGVVRFRWPVVLVSLLGFALLAAGASRIRFAGDYRVFFSKSNPLRAAFEELQNTYAKNESLLFVVEPTDGDVFTRQTLMAIESLTARAWEIPYSTRVDSLTNFQHTVAEEDDLLVENLVRHAADLAPEAIEHAREIALGEPRLVHRLISPSGHVAGVNVLVQFEGDDPARLASAVAHARGLAEEIHREFPGVQLHLSGAIMLHNAFMEATQHDLTTLVPLMYLAIIVFMFFFLRSVAATLATVVMILLSTAAAMGTAGWLGVALTPVSAGAPTLIMTLAVADSLHFLMSYLVNMSDGKERGPAVVEALRVNFQPIFLTSLTTAIGFLSMNSSDAPPLHDLGNVTAIGIILAFLAAVIFLPALAAILPATARIRGEAAKTNRALDWLARLVTRRYGPLLWVGCAVLVVCGALVPSLELNDSYVGYFDESVPFRQATDFTVANLTGIHQLEYSIPSGDVGGVSDPSYLRLLDDFANWWREKDVVIHVDSFSDTMKRLNQSLHGDDPAWYRPPAERELAAQYLLLYELSLPFGLDLNHQIDIDKSATRFSVTLEERTSRDLIDISEEGNRWLREQAGPDRSAEAVGPSVMFAHIAISNIYSMLLGTLFAFLLISASLVVAFRSLRFGLLSLIPNVAPAIIGFGLWGLFVGQMGFLLSIVLAMTLGIVVDDTVHFLSKYLRARREHDLGPAEAIHHAFASAGRALVATTVVLAGGFLILSLSTFAQNSDMGRLTALIILVALVADFVFLPALLMVVDHGPGARGGSEK